MAEIKHGTAAGYRAGCRLECCRAAKRAERAGSLQNKSADVAAAIAAHVVGPPAILDSSVLAGLRSEITREQRASSPVLYAMAEALAVEIDRAAGLSVAGAVKQLAVTVSEIKAETKGASESDGIVKQWLRPVVVPAQVRDTA